MDDFSQGGPELRQALRHLGRLNRLLGGAGPAIYGVERLWRMAGRPHRLSVLDVGSGAGDLNQALLRWASRRKVELTIVLADVTEEAGLESARLFRDEPRVQFVRRSAFDLAAREADIVTASQFAHHFAPEELPSLFASLLNASRYGIVINDIHRHWLPWAAVWLVTRTISRNRYIRHDGPLSVAKGFRRADFQAVGGRLGVDIAIRWRPLFRYAAIIPRRREEAADAHVR